MKKLKWLAGIGEALGVRRIHAANESGVAPQDEAACYRALLDTFESLGDSCEFAALQNIGGVDRLALFKWTGVPPAALARIIAENLEGIEDPARFRLRSEGRSNDPPEYMIDHDVLQTAMHSFVTPDENSEEYHRLKVARHLGLLKRKFLEDAAAARRIYVYRSLAPRAPEDVQLLYRALRQHGPNRLLFVKPPTPNLAAGEVRLLDEGFAEGALDDLAVYEASTAIRSAMWPLLLGRAKAVLRAVEERAAA